MGFLLAKDKKIYIKKNKGLLEQDEEKKSPCPKEVHRTNFASLMANDQILNLSVKERATHQYLQGPKWFD